MTAITESEVRALLADASADRFQNIKGTYSITPSEVKALCESWLQLQDVVRIAKSYVNLRAEDFQVRGELFRDLAKSLEAIANKDAAP